MASRGRALIARAIAGVVILAAGALIALTMRRNGVQTAPLVEETVATPTQESRETIIATPAATATATNTPTPSRAELVFNGAEAMRHVEVQMAYGPRPTGSEASRQTAEYILSTLAEQGWRVEALPFTYRDTQGQNLVGRLGSRGGPVYIFGAHYDTRRLADRDPLTPDTSVPGANDGASGVAVLLELARVTDLTRVAGEVWLVFFDAEDNGGLGGWEYVAGSRIFVSELEITPTYMILVDMIGDADQDIYFEANSDPTLREHLWSVAWDLGYERHFIPVVRHSILDDHAPFLEQGIPAVDIIDFDYPYWHTTGDTIDKVSADSLGRVGRVLEVFIESGARYPSD